MVSLLGILSADTFWSESTEQPGGSFAHLVSNTQAVHESASLLSALSVLLPEKTQDMELSPLIAIRGEVTFDYRGSKCSIYDSAVTRETGDNRSKPARDERIGKKYQWIAMYQLASRLYDTIDRERDSWVQRTGLLSLILNEERKLVCC